MSNPHYAFIAGLVQGVGEWLPISSKTQVLFIANMVFGLLLSAAFSFGPFMEIGSLFSDITELKDSCVTGFLLASEPVCRRAR